MKKMILLISASLTFVACVDQNKGTPGKLPNIVFIMADDMGYGDAGCYNSESLIPTPNIDMLASEGMLFTDAHSPAAVCTPSRYGLLSGRYCWRTRLKRGVILGYDETPLIEQGRNTLGSLLQESGYRTASIGKWHIGLNWQTKNNYILKNDNNKWQEYSGVIKENEEHIDFSKPVGGGPEDLGFDYSFITLGCTTSDPPYVFIENSYPVAIPSEMPPDEYIGLPGFMTGLMDPNWSQEEVDPIFTGKGVDFIENHLENYPDKPFFLYLALSSPHIPFLVPDFAKGQTDEGPRGDLVYVVDQSVGEISKTLDKFQIKDNTLFIFTSDNGPRKGANGHKSAGDLRGFKGSVWDGGHRVPFIARWPGNIKAGSTSDALLSLTDMFATFRDIIGYKDIEGGEDSYSILTSLKGIESGEGVEKPRIFHSSKGVFAIRKGDWKLIEGGKDNADKSSHVGSGVNVGQLYDMSSDPNETNDIWEEHPGKVKELMETLDQIRNSENI